MYLRTETTMYYEHHLLKTIFLFILVTLHLISANDSNEKSEATPEKYMLQITNKILIIGMDHCLPNNFLKTLLLQHSKLAENEVLESTGLSSDGDAPYQIRKFYKQPNQLNKMKFIFVACDPVVRAWTEYNSSISVEKETNLDQQNFQSLLMEFISKTKNYQNEQDLTYNKIFHQDDFFTDLSKKFIHNQNFFRGHEIFSKGIYLAQIQNWFRNIPELDLDSNFIIIDAEKLMTETERISKVIQKKLNLPYENLMISIKNAETSNNTRDFTEMIKNFKTNNWVRSEMNGGDKWHLSQFYHDYNVRFFQFLDQKISEDWIYRV